MNDQDLIDYAMALSKDPILEGVTTVRIDRTYLRRLAALAVPGIR